MAKAQARIVDFSVGIRGKSGQFAAAGDGGGAQDILNMLPQRGGGLRTIPGVKELPIKLFKHDKCLPFRFEGSDYFFVYDPLYIRKWRAKTDADFVTNDVDMPFEFKDENNVYKPGFTSAASIYRLIFPDGRWTNGDVARDYLWWHNRHLEKSVKVGKSVDVAGGSYNTFLSVKQPTTTAALKTAFETATEEWAVDAKSCSTWYNRFLILDSDGKAVLDGVKRPFYCDEDSGHTMTGTLPLVQDDDGNDTAEVDSITDFVEKRNEVWGGSDLEYQAAVGARYIIFTNPEGILPPLLADIPGSFFGDLRSFFHSEVTERPLRGAGTLGRNGSYNIPSYTEEEIEGDLISGNIEPSAEKTWRSCFATVLLRAYILGAVKPRGESDYPEGLYQSIDQFWMESRSDEWGKYNVRGGSSKVPADAVKELSGGDSPDKPWGANQLKVFAAGAPVIMPCATVLVPKKVGLNLTRLLGVSWRTLGTVVPSVHTDYLGGLVYTILDDETDLSLPAGTPFKPNVVIATLDGKKHAVPYGGEIVIPFVQIGTIAVNYATFGVGKVGASGNTFGVATSDLPYAVAPTGGQRGRYWKHSAAADGRMLLMNYRPFYGKNRYGFPGEGMLAASHVLASQTPDLTFSVPERLDAGDQTAADAGFIQPYSDVGGTEVFWAKIIGGKLQIGLSQGTISYDKFQSDTVDGRLLYSTPYPNRPVVSLENKYVVVSEGREILFARYSREYATERYRTVTEGLYSDWLADNPVRFLTAHPRDGLLLMGAGPDVFVGTVDVKGDGVGWARLDFGEPVKGAEASPEGFHIVLDTRVVEWRPHGTDPYNLPRNPHVELFHPCVYAMLSKTVPLTCGVAAPTVLNGKMFGTFAGKKPPEVLGTDGEVRTRCKAESVGYSFGATSAQHSEGGVKIGFPGRKDVVRCITFEISG